MAWVLEHSQAKLGARLVLLSIANHCRADGTGAWPSILQVSKEARLSEREVQYAKAELIKLGELECIPGGGRGRPNTYRLPKMGARIAPITQEKGAQGSPKGCTDPPERVHTGAQEPSTTEPSNTEPSARKRKTAWPKGLTMTEEMRAYARSRGVADPEDEFIAWHQDCAANGRRYEDWTAAWQNRCRNYVRFGGKPLVESGTPLTDRAAEIERKYESDGHRRLH